MMIKTRLVRSVIGVRMTSSYSGLSCLLLFKLVELMTEFEFSGQISKVNFVVNWLLMTVSMVACSIRRLYTVFLLSLVEIIGSVLLLPFFL